MTPAEFLAQRKSTASKLLVEPGPDDAQLREMLTAAVRVPDHGKLQPWRFVRIMGDTRLALGERLAKLTQARDDNADPAALDKDRNRFAHAPLIIAVIARLTPMHKVPEQEQLLSAGLATYNLMLSAQTLGFGTQWLTGWPAYDATVGKWFGLSANEKIVAFVHIGTPREAMPERPRAEPMSLISDLEL